MTELEAHTRADQIVRHMLDDPLELRSFVAACLLADTHIAAQAATIDKLTEHNALLRAEVWARRAERLAFFDETPADEWKQLACKVYTAEAATDAAGAMEDK